MDAETRDRLASIERKLDALIAHRPVVFTSPPGGREVLLKSLLFWLVVVIGVAAIWVTVGRAVLDAAVHSQVSRASRNLLLNPGASLENDGWLTFVRETAVELDAGDLCFVVRDGGKFQQTVDLPEGAAGKYLVLIGVASSERLNADGDHTGLPYLYALIGHEDRRHITAHLQGQQLLASPAKPNVWVKVSGVFLIPNHSARVTLQLSQASRKGSEQTGSAARFDDLGVHVFDAEWQAQAFVARWTSPRLSARD